MAPRSKNAAATREKILLSARAHFLRESYDTVGLRDIAGDAGIDVALIGRYFGSKEELFKEVLRGDKGEPLKADVLAQDLPELLASMATEEGTARDDGNVERLLILLRSSSSPKAAAVVRSAIREDVLEPIARVLPGDDADIRASLSLSILMGMTVLRTVMSVEPLCACDKGAVKADLVRILTTALKLDAGASS